MLLSASLCNEWRSIKEVYQREASGLITPILWVGLAYGSSEGEGPLELSGGPPLTCAVFACTTPWGCSRGMAPRSQPWGASCVLFTWTDSQEEEALCQCAIPLCQRAFPLHALVPASVQMCGEGHGNACRELCLPFTICYVTKMAFQPHGRWISVHLGCPAVNRCQSCAGSGMIHAGCFIKQHGQGAGSGALPLRCAGWDAPGHPWGEMPRVPLGCCLPPALAAPNLLLCGAKQRPEALQSASYNEVIKEPVL